MNDESEADAEGLRQERERQFLELRRAVEEVDKTGAAPNGEPQLDGDHDAHRPDWIARGQAAINASVDPDEHETELVDLLCHLRHWAEAKGVSYDSANRHAAWHYDHEKMRSRAEGSPGLRVKTPQFDPGQRRRAIELIESMAWGDIEGEICCMERALQLALEATVDGFQRWEREGEEHFGASEFELSPQQIEDLDDEWRLAYVARLIRSLGLVYGVATDYDGRDTTLDDDGHGPAGLLRGLNDISYMPLVSEPFEG